MDSDYKRVAKAIFFLQQNAHSQPGLDEVADAVGLSAFHFQRLFRRWAGITPKRFLQYLTVDYAKKCLADASVLETSLQLGLSSQSRLYDHFITLEAMTPGEYKSTGTKLGIEFGVYSSPFGDAFIGVTKRGVCQLSFIDHHDTSACLDSIRHKWPNADLVENFDSIKTIGEAIFKNSTDQAELTLMVQGSNFQIKVWESLLKIPPGRLCSYGQLAKAIGRPKSSRAVANAIGANPIAYLIPCHRVIRSTGALGGYRWGLERKQILMAWEAAHVKAELTS